MLCLRSDAGTGHLPKPRLTESEILEEAGFLKSRREGAWVYYSLQDNPAAGFACALSKMTGDFSVRYPIFREDRVRLKNAVRLGKSVRKNLAEKDRLSPQYSKHGALMADKTPNNNVLGHYTVAIFPGKGGG